MLTVAQASPRGCGAVVAANDSSTTSVGGGCGRLSVSATIDTPSSPTRPFIGRRLVFGGDDADVSLPKVEEIPSVNTRNTTPDTTGCPEVEDSSAAVVKSKIVKEETKVSIECASDGVGHGGYYFLGVVDDITTALRADVEKIEADLANSELSEEVSGQLRTTVGKVNLLISQKFAQFRGLCNNCLEPTTTDFVTLPSDLEGFWAMVMLQVDDVRAMITSVDTLRQNNWKVAIDHGLPQRDGESAPHQNGGVYSPSAGPRTAVNRTQHKTAASAGSPASLVSTSKTRQNKEAADLARAQARERLRAAKRQYIMAKREEMKTNNNGTITAPTTETATNGQQQPQTATFLVL